MGAKIMNFLEKCKFLGTKNGEKCNKNGDKCNNIGEKLKNERG